MSRLHQILDSLDRRLCQRGLLRAASWDVVRSGRVKSLYAGSLDRERPQFPTHIGITPFVSSTHNIKHDIRAALPLPDGSVDLYQSEDVFEHISYDDVLPVIEEVYRVLCIGGLLRVSVPDYRCAILRNRSQKDRDGNIVFDPGGGGAFRDGKVVEGGHLWFPVYESVKALFERSSFSPGKVRFLHYTREDGSSVLEDIDYSRGHIQRTPDHDPRVQAPRCAMSIVVDAVK